MTIASQVTVSIVVAARNYGHFLGDCLKSCLAQDHANKEVIYSDDGSTDDSVHIASGMGAVKIIKSVRCRGVVAARNAGAEAASGDVLVFVDGDDLLTPDFVSQKLAVLKPEHSFAYGHIQNFGASTQHRLAFDNPTWDALLADNFAESASAIWARVFRQVGGYMQVPNNTLDDWHLWLRAARIAPPVRSESILLYRVHDQSKSRTTGFARPGANVAESLEDLRAQFRAGGAHEKPPLRVGFIFPNMHLGGAQQWLLSLLRHLPANGNVRASGVALVNREMQLASWLDRTAKLAPVYASGVNHPRVIGRSSARDAVATVAKQSDVLVCWCNEPLAELLPKDFAGPVVLMSHGCGEWSAKMMRAQQPSATHFAACSDAAATAFERGSHVTTLLNGAEVKACRPVRGRAAIRKEWGLKPNEIAVAHIGRFCWDKNPLAAAVAVAALGEPYRAIYVGGGQREYDVKSAVKHAVREPIIIGELAHVGDALAGIDCAMLASPQEGFSLGMIEAWLAGVPVVSTRVGAVEELERVHGPLVVSVPTTPAPQELAAAVKQAMSGRNKPRVAKAQKIAREHFTAEAMGRRWRDYLVEITNRA